LFSSRLDWDALRPNAISRLLAARRQTGARILDLTESNPTAAGVPYPEAEILGSLATPAALRYEPSPAGLPAAREAVAGWHAGRGRAVDPERLLLTSSTSEAYSWIFKLLCEPGDEILAPQPSYPLFEFLAGLELVRIRGYPLHYQDGWWMDLDRLEATITERTRAVVVVHPNNPTGSFVKRSEAARLIDLCERHRLAIVSDEVFSEYAFTADAVRYPTFCECGDALAFSLSGLSKIAGLPQMKLGWMAVSGPLALRAQAIERLELIADTYLSVSTPIQHAAEGLLRAGDTVCREILERVKANHADLKTALAAAPAAKLLHIEGGWYAVVQVPRVQSEEEWVLGLLDRRGVLVQPGFFYDFPGEAFLVLSLLTEPSIFREGAQRLAAHIDGSL
jgi:alanine-synthesizing transaminase